MMCLDSGFLGVSEVGASPSIVWLAGQTGLEWGCVPSALEDWHRKPCSRFLVWVRPGAGQGQGEAWTCHQRPLGAVQS